MIVITQRFDDKIGNYSSSCEWGFLSSMNGAKVDEWGDILIFIKVPVNTLYMIIYRQGWPRGNSSENKWNIHYTCCSKINEKILTGN
jgi:hypothetical protein